jgi:hypothetical protein
VRLGQLAQQHGTGTGTVLVAGDIYDVAAPSDRTLRQPIERMRQVPDVTWHLIPGNHDPHTIRPVGPADPDGAARQRQASPHPRAGRSRRRLRLPGAGRAHTPPCRGRSDRGHGPGSHARRGHPHRAGARLPHQFGSDPGATHNLIAFDRPDRAGLAYLALGDWHGAQSMGERAACSGTPEPDGFDTGDRGGGEALLVEIDGPRALPAIRFLPTGRYVWRRESVTLDGDAGVAVLETRLRGLHADLGHLWVLRLNEVDLHLQPSAGDLAALSRAGAAGVPAGRLAARAADPADPQRPCQWRLHSDSPANMAQGGLYSVRESHTTSA